MTSVRGLWLALWLAIAPGAALAQSQTAPLNPSLRASVNGVRDEAHARELGLRRFDVSIEIRGAVAQTTIEARFANPLSETLEGDFRLALPPGAVVTGYALDIDGKMVDGVLVDRPRAQAVYEARVRRRIDPGVASVSPDNVFQTHVFPIRPGGGRVIRLRFVTSIVGEDGFHMPVAIAAPQEGWSIAVRASGTVAAPAVALPGEGKLILTEADGVYAGKASGGSAPLTGVIAIGRPTLADVLVSRHATGELYLQLFGTLAPAPAGAGPARLRVYWDRSRSRVDSRTEAEIALLRRYIERVKPGSVELVAFNSSGAVRHEAASGEEAASWLKGLRYRGATSFAPIANDAPADLCLLFSDGGPTIDEDAPFAPRCRLDAISSAVAADASWLHHLASSHGGRAFSLDGENGDRVLAALAAPTRGVVAILDQDRRPLPFLPLDAADGQWLALARAPAGGGVTVIVDDGAGRREIKRDASGQDRPFDGEGALIASDRLATLGRTDQRSDFVALSRRYGVASPSLSFLVLEQPGDYLAAHIEPPADYPAEALDTYLKLRKAADAESAGARATRLEQVVGEWAEQVAWWKKRFDPGARPKRVATSDSFDVTEPGAPPPPPPPPPPSPMISTPTVVRPPDPQTSASDTGTIVLTGARRANLSRGAPAPGTTQAPTIEIDAWEPERPYLELYDGAPGQFDERFLEAERRHGGIPAFYLDTAEWLRKQGRAADAIEMVLGALELASANEVTLGIVADRLERYGAIDRAIELRERQMALDPDRPQPRRLLALALARRAALQPARARADLTRAIRLLNEVAVTPQDGRWDGIELIALMEANALVPRLRRLGGTPDLDPRLIALLDVDMRVVIDWSTDATDLDLWVDEPDGERAIYNNQRTAMGGRLSHDMTQGYGPEEYLLHHARPGTYAVQANVYAADRLDPNGPSLVSAHLFRDYGRPTQSEESVDIELTRDSRGAKMIGRMIFGAPGADEAGKPGR
jgi:tetratricopeptide (TPR) repeat protein